MKTNINKYKKFIGKDVIINWVKNDINSWHDFKCVGIKTEPINSIMFKGIDSKEGNHVGDMFWASVSSIKEIKIK